MTLKLSYLPLVLLLASCALQPITEPRRPNASNEPTPVPTAAAVEKPTYTVELGTVDEQLLISGRVAPIEQTDLTFGLDGLVAEVFIEQNDKVEIGDPIARLDTTLIEQELQSAEANLFVAEAELAAVQEGNRVELRQTEINRDQIQLQLDYQIAQAGDSPTAEQALAINLLTLDLERAELDLDELNINLDPVLEARVAQTQLIVDDLNNKIDRTMLVSTGAGRALSVNIDGGDGVTAGEVVVVIADLTQLEVSVPMPSCDMRDLAEGMPAKAIVPNRPDIDVPMTVRQLPYPFGSGQQSDEENCNVRVAFNNPNVSSELDPGDRISMIAQLAVKEDVLWLPPAAIREFNGRSFVVVQDGSVQKRLDVSIGLRNQDQIEIETGLEEGQVVIGP